MTRPPPPRSPNQGGRPERAGRAIRPAATTSTEFATTLDRAIHQSGMSLAQLSSALKAHGTPLSAVSLSYWRSGRTRPERSAAITALANLESILAVPAGHLTGALPAARIRERRRKRESVLSAPQVSTIEDFLAGLGMDWMSGLRSQHTHDRLTIGADGAATSLTVRIAGAADRSGVDRQVTLFANDHPDGVRSQPRALWGCSIGTTVEVPEHQLAVAELILPRRLDRGDSFVCEFEWVLPPGGYTDPVQERAIQRRMSSHVMEIDFHPDRIPERIERFSVSGPHPTNIVPVKLSGTVAQALWSNPKRGSVGIRWFW